MGLRRKFNFGRARAHQATTATNSTAVFRISANIQLDILMKRRGKITALVLTLLSICLFLSFFGVWRSPYVGREQRIKLRAMFIKDAVRGFLLDNPELSHSSDSVLASALVGENPRKQKYLRDTEFRVVGPNMFKDNEGTNYEIQYKDKYPSRVVAWTGKVVFVDIETKSQSHREAHSESDVQR